MDKITKPMLAGKFENFKEEVKELPFSKGIFGGCLRIRTKSYAKA
jgi:hypothetical protein